MLLVNLQHPKVYIGMSSKLKLQINFLFNFEFDFRIVHPLLNKGMDIITKVFEFVCIVNQLLPAVLASEQSRCSTFRCLLDPD